MIMSLGFVSTGFWGSYSLWMCTLLNLDIVGVRLGLSTGKNAFPSLNIEEDRVRVCGGSGQGVGEWEEVEIWIGNFLSNKIIIKIWIHPFHMCLL